MTDVDVAALRRLREESAIGELAHAVGAFKHYVGNKSGEFGFSIQEMHPNDGHDVPAEAQARYIVALVNAAPVLLDSYEELDRLTAEVRKVIGTEYHADADAYYLRWKIGGGLVVFPAIKAALDGEKGDG